MGRSPAAAVAALLQVVAMFRPARARASCPARQAGRLRGLRRSLRRWRWCRRGRRLRRWLSRWLLRRRRRRCRLRLGLRLRLDDRAVEPDQQDLRVPVESGERRRLDCEQRLAGVARDRRDLADRVTRRIDAAEARAHEQVADDDVRVLRQVGQRQESRAARAERDAAHPGTVHLHRYRVLGIGDQDDLGRNRAGTRDLAEDAGRVDRGLASEDAVARALVDEHALAERVEIHAHDLGDQRTLHDAG